MIPLACGQLGVLGRNVARSVMEELSTGLGFYWLVLMVGWLRGEGMVIVRGNSLKLESVMCIAVIKVRQAYALAYCFLFRTIFYQYCVNRQPSSGCYFPEHFLREQYG